MKYFRLILFSLSLSSCAVQNWASEEIIRENNYQLITNQSYFINDNNDTITPVMYPDGFEGILTTIRTNIQYPESARKQHIEGKVFVYFVVEKNGYLVTVKIEKSVHPLLDKEATRIVKQLDRFVPGVDQNGRPVRFSYTLPINYDHSIP